MTFFISCKKSSPDEIAILIHEPLAGYSGNFNEPFPLKVEIHSSSILKSVSIRVTNTNRAPVSEPLSFTPGALDFFLDTIYIPENNFTSSGNYYLEVAVATESILTYSSTTVYLEATPRTLDRVYLLSAPDNHSFNIYQQDSASTNWLKNVTGDFLSAAISSRYRQLYTCGMITGAFNYFGADSLVSTFNVLPLNPPPATTFTSFHFSNELNFVGFYDGSVKGYDQTGFLRYDTGTDPYFISSGIFLTGNYVLVALESTGVLPEKKLAAYFYPGGARRQLLDIDFDIVSMHALNEDEKLLFTMKNGQLLVYRYSITNNNIQLLKDAGTLHLFSVTALSSTDYLLCTEQGIYHYQYDTGSSVSVASFPCYNVAYEEINNLYYCLSNHALNILNAGSFSTNRVIPFTDSLLSVQFLYNK